MSRDAAWDGSMPEIYDRALGPALFAPYAEHVAGLAKALAPRRVLELAAGTGIATAALVRELPDADLVATDLNEAMVSWAADHVRGPTWRQADAQQLDLPDGSFDLVVCQFGAMFLPDKPAAFAEAARVLVPGGTLLLTVWDLIDGSPFPTAMVASLAAVFPEDPPSFLVRVPHGYADPDRIGADLLAGGLEQVSIERVVLQGHAESARAVSDGYALGSPLRFALQERGEPAGLAAALGDEMEARLGPGPLAGDLMAFVITARRPS